MGGAPLSGDEISLGALGVNWIGCLLIGMIYGWIENRTMLGVSLRYFLITGFLGGFTTFSAFGMETLYLFKRGEGLMAWTYILTSVSGGLLLAWAGEKVSVVLLR